MVKISIDTTEDSHDHIRHVISMLQNIVGNNAVTNSTESSRGYVNIFGENPTPSEPSTPEPTQSSASEPSFFNIFGEDPAPSTPEPPAEPSPPAEEQVFGMPVAQAAPTTDQPTVQTTTPQRAPPQNAPPDIDMFDFFNKSKNQVKPY